MTTIFDDEEWEEFRGECEMSVLHALDLRVACWKTVVLLEQEIAQAHGELFDALTRIKADLTAQVERLMELEKSVKTCCVDEREKLDKRAIERASFALRRLQLWPRDAENRSEEGERTIARPKSVSNSPLWEKGVWRIAFSCD